jgi:hypothetical protein
MEIICTKILSQHQADCISKMWNDEYPIKLKDRFPILLDRVIHFNHYLIEDDERNVLAWAVDFEKENEIRFSIIVSSKCRGEGLGGLLVDRLKEKNDLFYGWVIDHDDDVKSNGERYKTPLPFYIKHQFEVLPAVRIDTEMIKAVKIVWDATTKK